MRLYAISDLHLDFGPNLAALRALRPRPDDWLLLAGDVGHSERHLELCLGLLTQRFARVVWTPGNHDLWTTGPGEPRGEDKYRRLIELCRARDVLTPEDPFATVRVGQREVTVAPTMLLYDYSFRPAGIDVATAIQLAAEARCMCADELYLHPHPHRSVAAWCRQRVHDTEARLAALPPDRPLVLLNHFPLLQRLIRIRIPRFSIWCGTTATEDWHRRFNVAVVVTGHLHVRATDVLDGVRFEEVSLGYPSQWRSPGPMDPYLRQILPPVR